MSKLSETRTETSSDTYQTPPDVLALVREVRRGQIDLDPCTDVGNWTQAKRFHHAAGLEVQWNAGFTFMNPPYGGELPVWVNKARMEHLSMRADTIVTLTPARPDTRWYDTLVRSCAVTAEVIGRITFYENGVPAKAKKGKSIGKVMPCQFPCVLGLMTRDTIVVRNFCRVMERGGFARIMKCV